MISSGDSIKNVLGQCIVQGKIRKIRASKSPLYDNGEIIGLVGYFMDITDEIEMIEKRLLCIFFKNI